VPPVLFVNPSSGGGSVPLDELSAEATRRGVRVHVLRRGEDLEALARQAEADVLGMAGGDGSFSALAVVAIDV
jgi:hypothetical protein